MGVGVLLLWSLSLTGAQRREAKRRGEEEKRRKEEERRALGVCEAGYIDDCESRGSESNGPRIRVSQACAPLSVTDTHPIRSDVSMCLDDGYSRSSGASLRYKIACCMLRGAPGACLQCLSCYMSRPECWLNRWQKPCSFDVGSSPHLQCTVCLVDHNDIRLCWFLLHGHLLHTIRPRLSALCLNRRSDRLRNGDGLDISRQGFECG